MFLDDIFLLLWNCTYDDDCYHVYVGGGMCLPLHWLHVQNGCLHVWEADHSILHCWWECGVA